MKCGVTVCVVLGWQDSLKQRASKFAKKNFGNHKNENFLNQLSQYLPFNEKLHPRPL